jgi:hypothetical protein
MGLFGKIVATAINVATLPVAVAKDIVTLGNCANGGDHNWQTFTGKKLDQIKDEAE